MAIYLGSQRKKLMVNNKSHCLKIITSTEQEPTFNNIVLKTIKGEYLTTQNGSYLTIKEED